MSCRFGIAHDVAADGKPQSVSVTLQCQQSRIGSRVRFQAADRRRTQQTPLLNVGQSQLLSNPFGLRLRVSKLLSEQLL